MSFLPGPNVVLSRVSKGKRSYKVILGVQNNPKPAHQQKSGFMDGLLLKWSKKYYPGADHIIALSQGVANDLNKLIPGLEEKTSVIHNIGIDDQILGAKHTVPMDSGQFNLIACGRLTEQKGYPYLLDSLELLPVEIPWKLHILGKGPLENELKNRVDESDYRDKVEFLGFQSDPFQYMRSADVFLLSSLWEGFGNVVVEAMGSGLPVIVTDCDYGPGEIVNSPEQGVLVPVKDPRSMADEIIRLWTLPEVRSDLAREGRKRSLDFRPEIIAAAYEDVFRKIHVGIPPNRIK